MDFSELMHTYSKVAIKASWYLDGLPLINPLPTGTYAGTAKDIKTTVPDGVPAYSSKISSFGACGGVEKMVFLYNNAENRKYINISTLTAYKICV